jgi:dTDP-4-dehydrorhamnose 3,5-epimerase
MRFEPTPLARAFVVVSEPVADERGSFARTYCKGEFAQAGLRALDAQASVSFNRKQHTLRGMHYQAPPRAEAKLVTCVAGRIFDVIVDLRRDSPTFCGWFGLELGALSGRALYVPEGCAHGFVTLEANSVVDYRMSVAYRAELSRGVRFDDPAFAIAWPTREGLTMSPRDRAYQNFDRAVGGVVEPFVTDG